MIYVILSICWGQGVVGVFGHYLYCSGLVCSNLKIFFLWFLKRFGFITQHCLFSIPSSLSTIIKNWELTLMVILQINEGVHYGLKYTTERFIIILL